MAPSRDAINGDTGEYGLTETLEPAFQRLLDRVQTPGQYLGGEVNSIVKPAGEVRLRMALAFPDTYEVGMSHHGCRLLYEIVNRLDGVACERVFAPLPDMADALRAAGRELSTLETRTPLSRCQVLGFSVQCELAAATVLEMLDLGGVPLLASERGTDAPLVIAGGGVFNPEPLADFVDAFIIGDGEQALPALLGAARRARERGCKRAELLRELATTIPGVYVPGLYRLAPNAQGLLVVRPPTGDEAAPFPIQRARADWLGSPLPCRPVVPTCKTVHERVTLEIMRGCPHGCRFCQAGFTTRPVRARGVEELVRAARATHLATGYDEIGLLSLSSGDHPEFDRLVAELDATFAPLGVSLSLPSLRIDQALRTIPRRLHSVRKGALTLAPEAGTDRLRAVINKNITNDDLLAGVREAFAQGWRTVKLYAMLGLPSETDEDVLGLARLANHCARLRRKRGRKPAVTLAVGNFVPKAHTPLQWEGMCPPAELERRRELLGSELDRRRVQLKHHDTRLSLLEGVLARGDRRLGRVILRAWRNGARLDTWDEHFIEDAWQRAFTREGIDPLTYACRPREPGEPQPWSHVHPGVHPEFLLRERERALAGERTPSCADGRCAGCGAQDGCAWRPERADDKAHPDRDRRSPPPQVT